MANVYGKYKHATWHSQYAILAACSVDGVELFNEEGQKHANVLRKDGCTSGQLAWHPTKKLLATNWSNGTLAIWNEAEKTLREANRHDCKVGTICWSPNGHRLVSGDEVGGFLYLTLKDGKVVVWRCDVRGRLTSLCQYRFKSPIVQSVFRNQKSAYDSRYLEIEKFNACKDKRLASIFRSNRKRLRALCR